MKNQHIISSSDIEGGTKQQGRYKKSQRNRAEAKGGGGGGEIRCKEIDGK